MPTRTSVQLLRDEETRLASGDGSVTVLVSNIPNYPPARLIYMLVALSQEQLKAASDQGLLTTNQAFALNVEPSIEPAPAITIAIRYQPQQTAGIEAASLALYRFDPQRESWIRLENCMLFQDENRLQCQSQRVGTFLLAGTVPDGGTLGRADTTDPASGIGWLLALFTVLVVAGIVLLVRRTGRLGKAQEQR